MTDELYIGLMSGTSLDGIDAALVRFENNKPFVLDTVCLPIPPSIKDKIKALIAPAKNEINHLMALDIQLAELFSHAVLQLVEHAKVDKEKIIAIGSHGQTIRHFPTAEYPSTLQIADPNTIAERTGITTVADFRRRDMAAGGQGAPLVPAFHEKIFRDEKKNRVILNLGGIANVTILPADKNKPVIGFDTGPANTLMNHWTQQQQNKSYDEDGNWAASGKINKPFLEQLLNDPYFTLSPPKSTGTEYFSAAWLTKKIASAPFLAAEDVQASLTMLSVKTIIDAIDKQGSEIDEIIICGGGVHNQFLLNKLKQGLSNIEINSSAKYGLDPDYIEATAFAWLAKQTMEHKSSNLPSVTGADRAVILGGVYFAGG